MRYLAVEQVLALHRLVCSQSGGSVGVRDMNALEAAVAQPAITLAGAICIHRGQRRQQRWHIL
jgi:death on curing protein